LGLFVEVAGTMLSSTEHIRVSIPSYAMRSDATDGFA